MSALGVPNAWNRREKLERDEPAEPEVFGLVDHTHATGAELGDDAIVRDRLADHQGVTRTESYTWAALAPSSRDTPARHDAAIRPHSHLRYLNTR